MNKMRAQTMKTQTGAVLPITLILMVLMTLVGLSTMNTSVLSERMAGNFDNVNVAFQATEAALRDAEQDMRCESCRGDDAVPIQAINGLTGFTDTCRAGLCYFGTTDKEVLEDDDANGDTLFDKFVTYGAKTDVDSLAGTAQQAKYIIEGKRVWPPGAAGWKYYYVITAVGSGKTVNSKSILREKFIL
jgi:type IV pilus assembly protein PilX